MNSRPLVTIVTPSYNQGEFIESTILSVINQTYKNIQYIIVDGLSNDDTMSIVRRYEGMIDVIIHEKDNGQSDAINKGFKLAKGELVGWLNSDDILYPECVERIVELYGNNPDGSIYYCSRFDHLDRESNIIKTVDVPVTDRNHLQHRNYSVVQPGSFYKSELVRTVGYIDETIHYSMDLDLWLRLLLHGNIYSVDKVSYCGFRMWEGSKTINGGGRFLSEIRHVLRKNNSRQISPAMFRTYWYTFKTYVKTLVNSE